MTRAYAQHPLHKPCAMCWKPENATMTDPQTPATEALLLQGLEAAFATSGGNVQTPRAIFDFLRISYLPAIEAEARADPIPATFGCPCDTCQRLRIRALAEHR